MTLRDIYKHYTVQLKNIYPAGEAAAITEIIFEHFAGISRSQIITQDNQPAGEALVKDLETALEKLLRYTPVQYIIGYAWFCNRKFTVNEHVLIPRPETEELVLEVTAYLERSEGKRVLDIGTGSGCIPISLKLKIPAANIVSIDISGDALKVAAANAVDNKVYVEFIEMDFLNEAARKELGVFDLIISNPPYIPETENNLLDLNVVMHEPHLALFVPQNDPLVFYKKTEEFASQHLAENGRIFLEVHENFAKETAALFPEKKYNTVIKKDISGKERMLVISRCP